MILYLKRAFWLPLYLVLRYINLRLALATVSRSREIAQAMVDTCDDDRLINEAIDSVEASLEYLKGVDRRIERIWQLSL